MHTTAHWAHDAMGGAMMRGVQKIKLCTHANGNRGRAPPAGRTNKYTAGRLAAARPSVRLPAMVGRRHGRNKSTPTTEMEKREEEFSRDGRHAVGRVKTDPVAPPRPHPSPPNLCDATSNGIRNQNAAHHGMATAPHSRYPHPQQQRRAPPHALPRGLTLLTAHNAAPPPRSTPPGGTNRLGAATSAPVTPLSWASAAASAAAVAAGVVAASHRPSSSSSHHSCG